MTRVVPVALLTGLLAGGCRGTAADAAGSGAAVDPLAGVQSDIDAVERDLGPGGSG